MILTYSVCSSSRFRRRDRGLGVPKLVHQRAGVVVEVDEVIAADLALAADKVDEVERGRIRDRIPAPGDNQLSRRIGGNGPLLQIAGAGGYLNRMTLPLVGDPALAGIFRVVPLLLPVELPRLLPGKALLRP